LKYGERANRGEGETSFLFLVTRARETKKESLTLILPCQNNWPMHFIRFAFLVAFISASPTEQHDGTISYFNNNYRSNSQLEESGDIELFFRSHKTEPLHQAKIGMNGIESKACSTKRAAEKEAICLYLMQTGGEAEVRRVCIERLFKIFLHSPIIGTSVPWEAQSSSRRGTK
jgi:hypothetical protein